MRETLSIFSLVILMLIGCSKASELKELDSDDFKTKEKRVDVLKKEIKYPSDFEDAEFELFNVNGFSNTRTGIPGASSWDYKFVLST